MKNKTSDLTRQLYMSTPLILLLLLFQTCFSVFVNCVDNSDIGRYPATAFISLAGGISFVFFTVKYKGDTICAFIFAVLHMLGTALQATLNNITKYIIFTIISLAVMGIAFLLVDLFVKKSFIEKYSKLSFIVLISVSIAIIVILSIFGSGEDGTKSWLKIGGFSFQLTEFLKPLFACFLSLIFASRYISDKNKLTYGTVIICVLGMFMLYIGEMGTLLVLCFVYIIMVFLFIKDRKKLLKYFVLIAAAVFLLILAIAFINSAFAETENSLLARIHHVAARLTSRWNAYIHPEDFRYSDAKQVLDAQKAMAKGGFLGSNTNLKVYSFESDMIFPYILMRLGLIVGLLVIASFAVFYFRIQESISKQKDIYRYAFHTALLSIIIIQTLIIAFGSLNFIPLTGIPMPLLSAGGTAMIINFAFWGLLLRESCQKKVLSVDVLKKFTKKNKEKSTDSVCNRNGKRKIIRYSSEAEIVPTEINSTAEVTENEEIFLSAETFTSENSTTDSEVEITVQDKTDSDVIVDHETTEKQ